MINVNALANISDSDYNRGIKKANAAKRKAKKETLAEKYNNAGEFFSSCTKYLLEDMFDRIECTDIYDDVLRFFKKNSKKDYAWALDDKFCASLRIDEVDRFIEVLIFYIENGKKGYSKTLIQFIMNKFILHKGITYNQLNYMIENNYLYYIQITGLKASPRFKKLPKYLQKNIINKINELGAKIR